MNTTILDLLNTKFSALKAKGVTDNNIAVAVKKIIHSPVVALLVSLTPTKTDDVILEVLKSMFPVDS